MASQAAPSVLSPDPGVVAQATAVLRRAAAGDLEVSLPFDHCEGEVGELSRAVNAAMAQMRELRAARAQEAQLRGEMAVARRIQDSMLPRELRAEGLEVAARSVAADQVGGDYYDVLPTKDGAWIGIGDVAGHGLPAGIIMLTVQSAIAALTREKPDATPQAILGTLNEVIHENIHHRLGIHDYVTLSLMRFFRDGRLLVAGAHEDIIVYRAREGRCEIWPTEGTWIGVINDIREFTHDVSHQLYDGDLMLLFTDGVTEATTEKGAPFGFERLVAIAEELGRGPVQAVVDRVIADVARWSAHPNDDMSVVVLRYHAPNAGL